MRVLARRTFRTFGLLLFFLFTLLSSLVTSRYIILLTLFDFLTLSLINFNILVIDSRENLRLTKTYMKIHDLPQADPRFWQFYLLDFGTAHRLDDAKILAKMISIRGLSMPLLCLSQE
jgi:hypothetical protein